MLFSSTNFGEQYFLFDDYYIPLYRYVKEKFSVCSYVKIAKFNSTIHLYSGILFCTSGV